MGGEVPNADREAVAAADQAGQDHRGRRPEPDRAREPARHGQRQPRDHARQSHAAAAGRARRLHGGARSPRWRAAPRRSTCSWWSARARSMPPSRSAWRWSTNSMQRSAAAIDAAFSEKAWALTCRHGAPRAVLSDTSVRQAGTSTTRCLRSTLAIDTVVSEKARALTHAVESHVRRCPTRWGGRPTISTIDDARASMPCAAPPTASRASRCKAIEGLSEPGRPAEERVGEPAAAGVGRDQPASTIRASPSSHAASALGVGQHRASTPRCRSVTASSTTRCSACPARPTSSTRSCAATRQTVEGSLADAEARARHLHPAAGAGHAAHAQAAGAEVERLRTQTDAHSQAVVSGLRALATQADRRPAMRAIEDMRAEGVRRLAGGRPAPGLHANRFNETSDDLRSQACARGASRSSGRRGPQQRSQPPAGRAGARARRGRAAAHRRARERRGHAPALNEQLRALEQLSSLSARERRDVTPAERPCRPRSRRRSAPPPMPPSPARRRRRRRCRPTARGERWSLGDLLARASRDDDGVATRARARPAGHRQGARSHHGLGHLVALPRRPARHHGALDLHQPRAARCFDEVSERYEPMSTSAAPSTASSPTSSGWCATSSSKDPPRACTTT